MQAKLKPFDVLLTANHNQLSIILNVNSGMIIV